MRGDEVKPDELAHLVDRMRCPWHVVNAVAEGSVFWVSRKELRIGNDIFKFPQNFAEVVGLAFHVLCCVGVIWF
jgi:hypothetical protein